MLIFALADSCESEALRNRVSPGKARERRAPPGGDRKSPFGATAVGVLPVVSSSRTASMRLSLSEGRPGEALWDVGSAVPVEA